MAEAGRGSVRDALSLLDRVLSADAESVTLAGVRELLGLATVSPAQLVACAVAEADARGVLSALAEAFQSGSEPEEVASDLAACFVMPCCSRWAGLNRLGFTSVKGVKRILK